jgi:hypothetical protein
MDEEYGVKSLEEFLPQDVLNCDRDFTSLSVQQKVAELIPGILPSAAVSSKSPAYFRKQNLHRNTLLLLKLQLQQTSIRTLSFTQTQDCNRN